MDSKRAIKIRNMRAAAGLNQAQVATAVGMSRQEYGAVDAGKIDASAETYTRIEMAILSLARERAELVEQALSA